MASRSMNDHEASRNRIDWLAGLDTEAKLGKSFRRTSIICTIGERRQRSSAHETMELTWDH